MDWYITQDRNLRVKRGETRVYYERSPASGVAYLKCPFSLLSPAIMPTNQHGITAELSHPEIFWRDNYEHILECGYRLRTRYKPDWVPSWKTDRLKSAAEDRLRLADV